LDPLVGVVRAIPSLRKERAMFTDRRLRIFAGLIAVMVIVGFLFLYAWAMYNCLAADPKELPKFSSEYIYVATTLAGLVGGVVAMIFNEKLPDISEPEKKNVTTDPTPPPGYTLSFWAEADG
jgi:hypothetical protein